jgi:hypothetical protein
MRLSLSCHPQLSVIALGGPRAAALPKSALAKACTYTLRLWGRLTRFLDYLELELSNNWVENSTVALGLGWLSRIKYAQSCEIEYEHCHKMEV